MNAMHYKVVCLLCLIATGSCSSDRGKVGKYGGAAAGAIVGGAAGIAVAPVGGPFVSGLLGGAIGGTVGYKLGEFFACEDEENRDHSVKPANKNDDSVKPFIEYLSSLCENKECREYIKNPILASIQTLVASQSAAKSSYLRFR